MAAAVAGSLIACRPQGREPRGPMEEFSPPLASVLRMTADPTVHGPHVLPDTLDRSQSLGIDPGGASRFLAGGVRVLGLPNGAVRTSVDPLPESPKSEIASYGLPSRLGGGFLFVVQPSLYRSDTWLSPVHPIYTAPSEIAEVVIGLDRVYVRAANGSLAALNPRTGEALDLGPWPNAPSVPEYRALDGWLAVAIADLRGVIATYDAGATWKPLALPILPKSVEIAHTDPATGETFLALPGATAPGDFVVVHGAVAPRQSESCFAVRAGEVPSRLPRCPSPDEPPSVTLSPKDAPVVGVFGARPLLAAIEDGWPLDADIAIVARDGALGQVRLSDGLWTAANLDAFPSKTARCHPLPILVDEGTPALGFACAEPRGRTVLYTYDPRRFALSEIRRFDPPRAVLSFGNGAVAVRGACDSAASKSRELRYCVLSRPRRPAASAPSGVSTPRAPRWVEIELASSPTPSDDKGTTNAQRPDDPRRLLVFDDGRVGVLSPPSGKLAGAQLAFLGEGANMTVDLDFPDMPPNVERALESGVWLDGFEERKAGLASGWVEAAGAMIGVEIEEGGRVRVGEYVRDAGEPVVSGRYGLGWGDANRAYETTNGGATWTAIDVPKPLSRPPGPRERACGPVGCTAKGWMRVGWGKPKVAPPERLPAFRPAFRPPRDLDLICEQVVETRAKPTQAATAEPEDFFGTSPPSLRPEELKFSVDAADSVDRAGRGGPLARIYAWGPRSDDWSHVGRWTVRWLSPYGASADVHSTAPALAPFPSPDAARRALGYVGSGGIVNWSMAIGDDLSSALLIGRRLGLDATVLQVDAERNPLEVRREDGDPFAEIDFAMKAGGHWYLASHEDYGEPPASVVFRVDGGLAREFARVPRASRELRPSTARLAARSDGRAIGLVVDGQPPADRAIPLRWVLPLDIETGASGEPEGLGAADLGGREDLPPCKEGDTGWVLDTAWAGRARIAASTPGGSGMLSRLYVRSRLSTARVCLERVSGSFEGISRGTSASEGGLPAGSNTAADGATLLVSALHAGARSLLRCRAR
jgi:hypothetical protein